MIQGDSVNHALRDGLLAMARRDREVRAELVRSGELSEGYHPRMETVHEENGHRLEEILDERGWPGRSLVGEDGAEAAWLLAQHAIAMPALMRRARDLVEAAVAAREAEPWMYAYLDDRIRSFEGRPQRYGTQFDWDAEGRMRPLPIEDPEGIDERRSAVGLESMAERLAKMRAQTSAEGERPPADLEAYRRGFEVWLLEVGWRK
ncbi:MAG: DUF6624 domain-containing protein [Gemmatimonadota bacterium]